MQKKFNIVFWGSVLALILFFMSMVDGSMLLPNQPLILCQFGVSNVEFIMEAKQCRGDGGIVYRVQ
jgi:hypothetical protein